jgi:hypothetical protein
MRKIATIIIIVLIIPTLYGCGNVNGDEKTVSESQQKMKELQIVDGRMKGALAKNLNFDADVLKNVNDTNMIEKYSSSQKKVDEEKIKSLLLEGDEISERVVEEEQDLIALSTMNGSILNISVPQLSFMSYKAPNISYAFTYGRIAGEHGNHQCYSMENDLPFESRESAFEKIKQLFLAIDIEISNDYQAFSLDHKTMKEQQELYVKENTENVDAKVKQSFEDDILSGRIALNDNWTQEDDCYYFVLKQKLNGISICDLEHGNVDDGTYIGGTYITVQYSKNGIVDLRAFNMRYATKDMETQQDIISEQKVADLITKKYSDIILSIPLTVKKLELQYLATTDISSSVKLIPVWVVAIEESNPDVEESGNIIYVIFDAVTGREIA